MTKSKALVLGGFTLWPIVYMVLFMVVMFTQVLMMNFGNQASSGHMPTMIKIIFPLHFLTMIWIFVLVAIYIRHIFKTEAVPQEKKALWAVVIFMGNMVAMPVYWYLYIWKKIDVT
jgi:hypothetical protein